MEENEVKFANPGSAFNKPDRRRSLLPWWIIACIWLFLIFAALLPVGIVMGLIGHSFDISLLGLKTDNPFSMIGIFLMLLFAFKGVVAFGLWTEKKWAVTMAKIDAIISIVTCCFAMAYSFFGPAHSLSLRLELIILIPYLYKMNSIGHDWKYFDDQPAFDPLTAEFNP